MSINYSKKQTFNSNELSFLFSAFGMKLFVRPRKGDIYSRNNPNGSCTFYFNAEYYEKLKINMTNTAKQGKFAESNAESDWTNLLYRLIHSIDIESNEKIPTEDYYEVMCKYWGTN